MSDFSPAFSPLSLFLSLPAAIFFPEMIPSLRMESTPASSRAHALMTFHHNLTCWSQAGRKLTKLQTVLYYSSDKYLGKSSSCHSSFTSMLSMRKVASAVPILCLGGGTSAVCKQQNTFITSFSNRSHNITHTAVGCVQEGLHPCCTTLLI